MHYLNPILSQLDSAPLECDGMTRLISGALANAKVPHAVHVGRIGNQLSNRKMDLHYWIDLTDGHRIDYRAQMWLGKAFNIPHGIFIPSDYPFMVYQGEPTQLRHVDSNARLLAGHIGIGFKDLVADLHRVVIAYKQGGNKHANQG